MLSLDWWQACDQVQPCVDAGHGGGCAQPREIVAGNSWFYNLKIETDLKLCRTMPGNPLEVQVLVSIASS